MKVSMSIDESPDRRRHRSLDVVGRHAQLADDLERLMRHQGAAGRGAARDLDRLVRDLGPARRRAARNFERLRGRIRPRVRALADRLESFLCDIGGHDYVSIVNCTVMSLPGTL